LRAVRASLTDLTSQAASEYRRNLDEELVYRFSLRRPPGVGLATPLARTAMVQRRRSATPLFESAPTASRVPAGETPLLAPTQEEFHWIAPYSVQFE
jgi:hypothetical protein